MTCHVQYLFATLMDECVQVAGNAIRTGKRSSLHATMVQNEFDQIWLSSHKSQIQWGESVIVGG